MALSISSSVYPRRAWGLLQCWLALFVFSPIIGAVLGLFFWYDTIRKRGEIVLRRPLTQAIAILSAGLVLTCLLGEYPGDALLGLFHFLPFFLQLVVLGEIVENGSQLRRMAQIVVFSSIPVAAMGLGQMFWEWSGPVRWLGIVINWELAPGGNPLGRLSSVFDYANDSSTYFLVAFVLSLGLMGDKQRKKRWVWLLLGLATVLDGTSLFLTHSRNGWAIAILAILAYALYWGWHWLVGAITAGVGLILWSAFGIDPSRQWLRAIVPHYIWARLTDEMFPDRPLAQLRSTQWQFALDLIHQHPFTGWGLRSFSTLYETQMNYWIGHPHNLPLMLFSEVGILVAVWFFCLVTWILAKAVYFCSLLRHSTEQAIVFTYLVAFASIALFHLLDITLFDSRINFLGWWLLGSLLGWVYHSSQTARERANNR